jgi:hypothetical protein
MFTRRIMKHYGYRSINQAANGQRSPFRGAAGYTGRSSRRGGWCGGRVWLSASGCFLAASRLGNGPPAIADFVGIPDFDDFLRGSRACERHGRTGKRDGQRNQHPS